MKQNCQTAATGQTQVGKGEIRTQFGQHPIGSPGWVVALEVERLGFHAGGKAGQDGAGAPATTWLVQR